MSGCWDGLGEGGSVRPSQDFIKREVFNSKKDISKGKRNKVEKQRWAPKPYMKHTKHNLLQPIKTCMFIYI